MRKAIADATERRIRVTEGCASGSMEAEKLAQEASLNGFKTKAEMDDANEQAIMEAYIDLIQQEEKEQYGPSYTPPTAANPAGPRALSPPPAPSSSKSPLESTPEGPVEDNKSYSDTWACSTCTLVNPAMFLACEACTTERPQPTTPLNLKPDAKQPAKRRRSKSIHSSTDQNKPRKSAVESLIELEAQSSKRPLGWVCHSCGAFMESKWWSCSACRTIKLQG